MQRRSSSIDARQIKGAIGRPHVALDMGREYGAVIIETRGLRGWMTHRGRGDISADSTRSAYKKLSSIETPATSGRNAASVGYSRGERAYASRSRHVGRDRASPLVCAFYRGPLARPRDLSSAFYELPFAKDVPRYAPTRKSADKSILTLNRRR